MERPNSERDSLRMRSWMLVPSRCSGRRSSSERTLDETNRKMPDVPPAERDDGASAADQDHAFAALALLDEERSAALEPGVAALLPADAEDDVDGAPRGRVLELAHDGDDVGRVAYGGERRAHEVGAVVLEDLLAGRRQVEEQALEGQHVDHVVHVLEEHLVPGLLVPVGEGAPRVALLQQRRHLVDAHGLPALLVPVARGRRRPDVLADVAVLVVDHHAARVVPRDGLGTLHEVDLEADEVADLLRVPGDGDQRDQVQERLPALPVVDQAQLHLPPLLHLPLQGIDGAVLDELSLAPQLHPTVRGLQEPAVLAEDLVPTVPRQVLEVVGDVDDGTVVQGDVADDKRAGHVHGAELDLGVLPRGDVPQRLQHVEAAPRVHVLLLHVPWRSS
ncbi:hypothetical protein VTK73DRAFT_5107 [Phialemonium thermophilum]|uniref:Uncharacterized protein n=1 Tax=Phialemonium thermophilum TaxID=223376 RepID=A0ABR3V3I0_9PEZI